MRSVWYASTPRLVPSWQPPIDSRDMRRNGHRILRRAVLGCASLLLVELAGCRSRPASEIPFHAGDARTATTGRPTFTETPLRPFVANAIVRSSEGIGDGFGSAIAAGGHVLAVAAPNAAGGGAVWVFDAFAPLKPPVRLQPPAGVDCAGFGASVSVSGQGVFIAVGAPQAKIEDFEQAGRVLLWRRDGDQWKFVDSLNAEPPVEVGLLGSTVAVSENVLVAGAPKADLGNRIDAGVVVAWKRELTGTWRYAQTLLPMSQNSGSVFGESIAMCDDGGPPLVREAVIGARTARSAKGTASGSVELFRETMGRWRPAPNTLFVGSKCEPLDHFGDSVASARGLVAIGAPGANLSLAPDAGRAYVFRCDDGKNWAEDAILNPPAPERGSNFGKQVAICANRVMVTAPDARTATGRGRVFGFQREKTGNGNALAWRPLFELTSSSPASGGVFGMAVAATGELVAVAETAGDTAPPSVHIFLRTDDALGVPLPAPASPPSPDAPAIPSQTVKSTENPTQPPASQGSV